MVHVALRLPQKRLRERAAARVEDGGGAGGSELLRNLAKDARHVLFVGDVDLVAHSRASLGLNLGGQVAGKVWGSSEQRHGILLGEAPGHGGAGSSAFTR